MPKPVAAVPCAWKVVGATVFLMLFAAFVGTYVAGQYRETKLNRPSPGPSEGGNKPDEPTGHKGDTTSGNRIGSDAVPLVVEVRHPPKGDPEPLPLRIAKIARRRPNGGTSGLRSGWSALRSFSSALSYTKVSGCAGVCM